jgi:hypothetical protein
MGVQPLLLVHIGVVCVLAAFTILISVIYIIQRLCLSSSTNPPTVYIRPIFIPQPILAHQFRRAFDESASDASVSSKEIMPESSNFEYSNDYVQKRLNVDIHDFEHVEQTYIEMSSIYENQNINEITQAYSIFSSKRLHVNENMGADSYDASASRTDVRLTLCSDSQV